MWRIIENAAADFDEIKISGSILNYSPHLSSSYEIKISGSILNYSPHLSSSYELASVPIARKIEQMVPERIYLSATG